MPNGWDTDYRDPDELAGASRGEALTLLAALALLAACAVCGAACAAWRRIMEARR